MKQNLRLQANDERGFTLLEILVATAIFGMIATVIFGVLNANLSVSKQAQNKMEIMQTGRFIISRITMDVSSASAFPISRKGRFVGKSRTRDGFYHDECHFTAFTRMYYGDGKPRIDQSEVGYYFLAPQEGDEILMRREADVIEEPVELGGNAFEISKRVQEFKIRYLAEGSGDWVNSWDSRDRGKFPKFVSVELTLVEKGRKYFFSTIVRVPA